MATIWPDPVSAKNVMPDSPVQRTVHSIAATPILNRGRYFSFSGASACCGRLWKRASQLEKADDLLPFGYFKMWRSKKTTASAARRLYSMLMILKVIIFLQ
jgi:hypothetical protein